MTRRSTPVWQAAIALVAIAGCGGDVTSFSFKTPPPRVATTSESPAAPDLTGVSVPPVAGRATTTIAMTPGPASLSGTVIGPSGPVPGATVRAERVVGAQVARMDAAVLADGTWSMAGIIGGLYRVRAWRAPDLALTTPQVFFLTARDKKSLTLQLNSYAAANVVAAVAPNPPLLDQPVNLAVQVTTQTVDGQGVVRGQGVAATQIQLTTASNWSLSSANPTVTDGTGQATWQLVCGALGGPTMSVTIGNTANTTTGNTANTTGNTSNYPLNVPACVNAPGATSTTSSSTTTTTTLGSTSTTRNAP